MPTMVMATVNCPCGRMTKVRRDENGRYFCNACGNPLQVVLVPEGVPRRGKPYPLQVITDAMLDATAQLQDALRRARLAEDRSKDFEGSNNRYVAEKAGLVEENRSLKTQNNELRSQLDEVRSRKTERIVRLEEENEVLRKRNREIQEDLNSANRDLNSANKKLYKTEEMLDEATARYNREADDHEMFRKQNAERIRSLEIDISSLESDKSKLAADRDRAEAEKEALESENSSLSESVRHYRNEAEAAGKIPVREVTKRFLDYMSAVYNIALDKCSPETIEQIEARTEYAVMNLANIGVDITYHRRGELLGNGRVELRTIETDDPEQDCKVIKSNRFGCSFSSDSLSDIPEEITVSKYVPPEPVMEPEAPSEGPVEEQGAGAAAAAEGPIPQADGQGTPAEETANGAPEEEPKAEAAEAEPQQGPVEAGEAVVDIISEEPASDGTPSSTTQEPEASAEVPEAELQEGNAGNVEPAAETSEALETPADTVREAQPEVPSEEGSPEPAAPSPEAEKPDVPDDRGPESAAPEGDRAEKPETRD